MKINKNSRKIFLMFAFAIWYVNSSSVSAIASDLEKCFLNPESCKIGIDSTEEAKKKAEEEAKAAAELAAKKKAEEEAKAAAELAAKKKAEEEAKAAAELAAKKKAEEEAKAAAELAAKKKAEEGKATVQLASLGNKYSNIKTSEQATQAVNEIQSSINMYRAVQEAVSKIESDSKKAVVGSVEMQIERLRKEKEKLQKDWSKRFSTPIKPNNANLSVTAFRAADTFPKIPFYVPGTSEIGEMLAVPRVTDDGFLIYQFDFLDPSATFDKVRDRIEVKHEDISFIIKGLLKVDEWTKVAQSNNVTRRVEKTASCIPEGACKVKKQGVSSTEVIFQVYENGSTSGRIQRNKGKFMVGYNLSVESSLLLSAYLTYMKNVGAKEFNIGTMTDEEVEKLFN